MKELILMLIIIIIIGYLNRVEHYDDKTNNLTLDNCANFCKTIEDCAGISYDKVTNTCYISRSPIENNPHDGKYRDSYSADHVKCNKVEPIEVAKTGLGQNERRKNATFSCLEHEGINPLMYLHAEGKLQRIHEKENPDFITDIEDYEVGTYSWPHKDILSGLESDEPNVELDKELVYDKDSLIGRIYNFFMVIFGYTIKETFENIIESISNSSNNNIKESFIIYKVYNDFNDGNYLKKHKCVKNISHENCLKYCTMNDKCVGTEWNPEVGNHKNVCCPKSTIGKNIGRSRHKKHGKFYGKYIAKKLDRNIDYMHY